VTFDEAVRDLLTVSTEIRQVIVVDDGVVRGGAPGRDDGTAVAPGRDDGRVVAAVDGLWQMAALTARSESAADGGVELEHVVVDLDDTTLIVLEAGGRRIVALTAPDPALGLALFDLRTCLADAFPDEGASEEPA
jgi:predicted regulator of Ras-like GTPase activity (Roadblock/LC7/MglB family)